MAVRRKKPIINNSLKLFSNDVGYECLHFPNPTKLISACNFADLIGKCVFISNKTSLQMEFQICIMKSIQNWEWQFCLRWILVKICTLSVSQLFIKLIISQTNSDSDEQIENYIYLYGICVYNLSILY